MTPRPSAKTRPYPQNRGIDTEALAAMWIAGVPVAEIATALDRAPTTISCAAKRAGLTPRGKGRRKSKAPAKPEPARETAIAGGYAAVVARAERDGITLRHAMSRIHRERPA